LDNLRNPYAPSAGAKPPTLAGRENPLHIFDVALDRALTGRSARGPLPYGLRGVGKTVLLNQFLAKAAERRCVSVKIEAEEGRPFRLELAAKIRQALFALDRGAKIRDMLNRAVQVLKSFALKFEINDVSMNLGVDPALGQADSGDIFADLKDLLVAVGKAAREQGTAVVIAVDEIQYVSQEDFGAIIGAIHEINQQGLPVLATLTGLPQVLALAGDAKSYAERIFEFLEIGALSRTDAIAAIQTPAHVEGVTFEEDAADAVFAATRGYPYFLQEWAYASWNVADGDTITRDDVRRGEVVALNKLDHGFFLVRYNRCTPSERRYLRAMAELGEGPYGTADVAMTLRKKATQLGPVRDSLIRKGMIWAYDHGRVEFTVPLFDEFMRRTEPNFDAVALE